LPLRPERFQYSDDNRSNRLQVFWNLLRKKKNMAVRQ
jgi:hypothetical protein